MLVQFSVGNFYSIKETQTMSMISANSLKEHQENIIQTDKYNLLKSAVIYGANASGKSTVIRALSFFKWLIINSATEMTIDDQIKIEPFRLSTATINKPSYFEIIILNKGVKYRYGYEILNSEVVSEWLYQTKKTREQLLFIRNKKLVEIGKYFDEGEGLAKKTRDNALFLSVCAQFNGSISGNLITSLRRCGVISGLNDTHIKGYTAGKLKEKDYRQEIMQFVLNADFGIKDLKLEEYELTEDKLPKDLPKDIIKELLNEAKGKTAFNLYSLRNVLDEGGTIVKSDEFEIDKSESEGTKKFFSLAGPIINSLKEQRVIVIDEFDARLHPILTKYIVSKFNSISNSGAQLIFATHDTNLLSNCNFRRDQIWFTEKDRQGATNLYSLAEFKVRNDESYEKNYLKGKYGGIPFLGETITFID